MHSLHFTFAETVFRVIPPNGTSGLTPPDEYSLFLSRAEPAAPDALYEVAFTTDAEPEPPADRVSWDNGVWRVRHEDSRQLGIDIRDPRRAIWRRAALMDHDFARGTLFADATTAPGKPPRPLYHPQDRAVILGRMCRLRGIMMHSSCVYVQGKALLFVGMSGAGKTTLARLWRDHGGIILNDERNFIRIKGNTVLAGASPWHGEENEVNPTAGPLAAVFFLHQAPVNRLTPLPLAESVGRMLTAAFMPVFIPGGMDETLDSTSAILQQVPAYGLEFTPDSRALELCRSVI